MQQILPGNPSIRSMGRVDCDGPTHQVWVFPYTQASFCCTGTTVAVRLLNRRDYGESTLGAIIDGVPYSARIPTDGIDSTVVLADHLPDIEHEVVVYKRQDGEHYLEILGFLIDDAATLLPPVSPAPTRRMEVFGDSVSCGERNEAVLYTGKPDPEVDLSPYSNSWYSYASITARNLGAAVNIVAQGGASLLDGIGWFCGPDYVGMESIWDRIEYNPALGPTTPWDFTRYTPQVVVVALGQNDANPFDFMAADYAGEQSAHWRKRYVEFIRTLRTTYPHATIIATTTLLQHDANWDRAIDDACQTLGDANVHHFLYSRNGSATPGHPRVSEHQEMARELTAFITGLGASIWS
jgi:lysophospholipase L1-like esterase